MPHWARKGSLCSQAPGRGGGVTKKAGARGGSSISPRAAEATQVGGRRPAGAGQAPSRAGLLPAPPCWAGSTPSLSSLPISNPGLSPGTVKGVSTLGSDGFLSWLKGRVARQRWANHFVSLSLFSLEVRVVIVPTSYIRMIRGLS